jgi:prevent-host-death family protein
MEVGIRELKARLSEFLGRVAAGETITVTDRGQPRALLVPIGTQDRVDQGVQEGWITRRSTRKPGAARPRPPAAGTPRSEEILADDRGE